MPEEPCTKSLQPPSREAFSLTTRYDVTFKSFSHKSPPLSGTPKTLHFKLGCYKQRPLGLGNCSGVSSGPREYPAPIICPARYSSHEGEYGPYRPRNTANARERSYPCGPPGRVTSGVCEFNFSSPQKRGWSVARSESPPSQSVHSLRTFQNGGDSYAEGSVKKRRLYGQDRPEGCLFHGASMEEPPKVSEVCLERNNVRVCLPALRARKCSQSLHETYEACSRPVTTTLHQTDSLFRRHANNGSVPGRCPPTCLNCPRSFARVGLHDNYMKSVLVPSTQMEFLGFVVDSLTLSLALPRDKIRKVRKECQTLLDSPLVTVRQLAKLLGHLTSTIQAVFPGPLHFRHLQSEKNRALVHSQTYDSATPLCPQAKEELVWWRDNLEAWNGKALVSGSPDLVIETDASRQGWGAFCNGVSTGGLVVSRGIPFPHKLSRTSGWGICCQDLCERQSPNASPLVNGQFDCRPLHKQVGGHKIRCSGTSGIRSMGVVPSPQYPHRGSVFTRGTKYPSRPRISSIFRPSRLETGPLVVCGTNSGLGSLGGRPVCLSALNSTSTVLQLETRPSFRGSGCVFPGLGQSEGICIPSLCSSRPLPQTVTRPECVTPCSSRTSLAVTAMVPSASRVVCSTSHSVPSLPGPADTTRGSPPLAESSTGRLATIRQSYSEAGISQPAQTLLVAAWRDGTSKAYASAWRRWDSWCRERKLNSVQASVESILEFLTSEFNLGRAYRTLNVYRSAISSTHPKIDSVRVGEHPLVVQLLKGAYNLRPPLPRYSSTWDVSLVVSFIDDLGVNESLSLKDLSQKLGFLLALTAMERVSEVVSHDLRYRRFIPEGVTFALPDLTKKSRAGKDLKTSFHAGFEENPNLCVVKCLKEYERRTSEFRPLDPSKANKLLLSYIRPHKPISGASLSRWLKEIISRAGIDTSIFKAHSVRGASASAAYERGASLQDILDLADWSTDSTFRRFYYRPRHNSSITKTLLNVQSLPIQ